MENGYSLSDIATATNGGMFGGSNEFIWIFALLILFGSGSGWGGNSALSQGDLQRAVDLNSIQEGQAGINANVQRTAYENMIAVKDAQLTNLQEIRDNGALISAGNANIINNIGALQAQMQNCCCETKGLVLENRYLDAQNTANINANTTAQTQKILDAIAQNKIDALQSQVGTLTNQLALQQAMCGVPKVNPYLYGITYAGCGCNAI